MTSDSPQGLEKKKPYKEPKLIVYGDITVITRTTMSGRANTDSNPSGMFKTV
jgi:hypothetical protein